MAEAPGFYGKVPALGDFVSRRVPAGFAAPWHEFLAGIVAGARARLGEDFPAWWNEAPVWHFTFGAGLAGPGAWCGVLIPSVDRVGRHFPFTTLGAVQEDGVAHATWALEAEALTLGALEDEFTPAALADALERLGPPALPAEPVAPGLSLWSCRDAPRMPATRLRWARLPDAADAALLVAP